MLRKDVWICLLQFLQFKVNDAAWIYVPPSDDAATLYTLPDTALQLEKVPLSISLF